MHLHLMLESGMDRFDFNVKHFIIGGEALSGKIVKDFVSRIDKEVTGLTNIYGPTECCVDSTCYTISKEDIPTIGSIPIGKPLLNQQVAGIG